METKVFIIVAIVGLLAHATTATDCAEDCRVQCSDAPSDCELIGGVLAAQCIDLRDKCVKGCTSRCQCIEPCNDRCQRQALLCEAAGNFCGEQLNNCKLQCQEKCS